MDKENKKIETPMHDIECFGTATLGKRGQVVIPIEIRKKLDLEPGEQFMVMLANESVVFIPGKKFEEMISKMDQTINQFKEISKQK